MNAIALSHISFPAYCRGLVRRAFRGSGRDLAAPDTPEDARDRGAFVQEMLSRSPGAFSSELDVQFMMEHFPRSF